MPTKITRRTFGKAGAAATLTFGLSAIQPSSAQTKILGANDRIRLGFIGVANRGRQLLDSFQECPSAEIAALCDIDANTLQKAGEDYGNDNTILEHDFQKLIDRNDLDALVLATPDHWHAYQTIEACKAGKDVYCEKPLSSTIQEGRLMVQAARKYKRIVQVGIHRRSAPLYQKIVQDNPDKKLGKVTVARSSHCSNMYPRGIGKAKPTTPPDYLDWDLWLGPKPFQPYQENIAPYKFRWWIAYCSQIANQGVHFLDAIRWSLGETAPASVCAMGGKFVVDDDRTIPDTLDVCFQFASGRLIHFCHYEGNGNPIMATDANYRPLGFLELRGTNGTMYVYDNRYLIKAEQPGQFQEKGARIEEEEYSLEGTKDGNANITTLHAQNFLDCMRSRELPNTDVEEGHRSTTMSLLANISLATGLRLEWDAEKERITNNDKANEFLSYEYRAPWKLEI